jgi:phosphoribosyl-AMP cyclohydrolase
VSAPGVPLGDLDQELLETVAFDSRGLVTAVVQDADGGDVLMVAHMDREALERTITTGRSWFFSRSRNELWCKGETSGDRQFVREVRVDCDGDAVLLLVDQHGDGACHTKEWSCFFRVLATGPGSPAPGREPGGSGS